MRSIRYARLVLVGMVLLLMVMPLGAAWATPPVKYTYSFDVDWWIADCVGFEVWEVLSADVRGTEFYDKDGAWVRTQEHWTADGYVYNNSDPTIQLQEMTVHNTGIFRETDGMVAGPLIKIQLPGQGIIFHQVGNITLEWNDELGDYDWTFKAGKNDLYGGNVDELCAALAP